MYHIYQTEEEKKLPVQIIRAEKSTVERVAEGLNDNAKGKK